jgi:hypothetical protein
VTHDPQYIDTFTRIDMLNGVVRLELGVLQPRGEGQPPEVAASGMLVMSVEGFVRSAATMQAFLEQLAAKGVLRRDPASAPRREEDKAAGKGGGPKSPNFT